MRSFRICRVLGIELRVDWSWVFILVLLTWNLVAVFSHWHQDWSWFAVLATAMSASLVFFGCIVLHELAHSLVARSYGTRVRNITLFLLGGVSNLEHEPQSAKAEFFTAIVGPITSIALGIGALALASLAMPAPVTNTDEALAAFARLGPVTSLLAWLGPINIMIGLFNLIPGFPLDGGRILRSLLWAVTGNLRSATRSASAIGQAVGWLFIVGGIAMTFGLHVPFFGTGFVSGLWFAFIGWFLHNAASQASTRIALDDVLSDLTVEQIMRREGPIAPPDLSVATLVHQHLVPGDDRALPVVKDGTLVGLVSVSDVRRVPPAQWAATPVSAIMRSLDALSVTTPEQPLVMAFEQLALRDIEQMPVVMSGRLVGMLRRRDIARWLELAWRPEAAATSARPTKRDIAPMSASPGNDRTPSHPREDAHHAV